MVTVLRAARLIDGTGAQPVDQAEIHVEGKAITYAGPSRDAPPAPRAEVLELGERTLLPGLIDCHAHPVSYTAGPGEAPVWADELHALHAVDSLRQALLS